MSLPDGADLWMRVKRESCKGSAAPMHTLATMRPTRRGGTHIWVAGSGRLRCPAESVDLVDGEPLHLVEEERLVGAAGEVLVEFGLVARGDDQHMLARRDALVGVVVVLHGLIAVEGET